MHVQLGWMKRFEIHWVPAARPPTAPFSERSGEKNDNREISDSVFKIGPEDGTLRTACVPLTREFSADAGSRSSQPRQSRF